MNARQKAKMLKRENESLRDLLSSGNVRPIKFESNHVEVKTYRATAVIDPEYRGLAESFAKRTIECSLLDEILTHVEYKTVHGRKDYLEGTIHVVV